MAEYTMDPDLVRQHASSIDRLAEDVAEAVAASQSVTGMSGEAFGLMCAFLVPPALAVTAAASAGMASEEKMLHRTARELRAVAAEVEEGEQKRLDAVTELQGTLD